MKLADLLRRDGETVAALTEALRRTEQAAADAVRLEPHYKPLGVRLDPHAGKRGHDEG